MTRVGLEFFGVDVGAKAQCQAAITQVERLRAATVQQTEAAVAGAESTAAAAEAKVAALVEERAVIRANMVAYQELAASAAKGSEKQVAATQLATNAQRELGVTSQAVAAKIVTSASAAAGATKRLIKPILALAAVAGYLGYGYEHAMQRIRTGAGASQKEVDRMKVSVLELAKTAGGGAQSPVKLANALYYLESADIRGEKALAALSAAAVNAYTTGADLVEVTKALAAARKVEIEGTETETKAMGTLNAIVGAGMMTLEDLTAALSTGILPAAKNVGITLPQLGAAIDTMTIAGVPAQQAATKLTATFLRMLSPTGAAAKSLKNLGISQQDLGIALQRGGLTEALGLLVERYEATRAVSGKVYATQQLMASFGRARGGAAILALVEGWDTYNDSLKQVNRTTEDYQKNSKAAMETPSAKAAQALSDIQASLTDIGVEVLPTFASLARALSAIVRPLSEIKEVFVAIALGALAAKVAIAAFYTFARIGAIVTAGAIDSALITTGIGAIVVALGIATVLVIKHWDKVKQWFERFESWARDHAPLIGLALAGPFGVGAGLAIKYWGGVRAWFVTFWDWIVRSAYQTALKMIEPFTHLKWGGGWARELKTEWKATLAAMKVEAAAGGEEIGDDLGRSIYNAASPALDSLQGSLGQTIINAREGIPTNAGVSKGAAKLAANAKKLSAVPYSWGGTSAQTGYDCSGFVQDLYRRNGINIPRTTQKQWADPNAIDVTGAEKPGDAVYFASQASGKNTGPPPRHVGIYIGGGKFVQAGNPRAVLLAHRADYMGARRWIKVTNKGNGGDDTGGRDTSYNPPSGAATSSSKPDRAELRSARSTARALARSVELVISPTLRAKLRKQIANLNKELEHVGSQKELTKLKSRAAKLKTALEKALALNSVSKKLRRDVQSLMTLVSRLPDEMKGPLATKLAALLRKTQDVTSESLAKRLQKQLDAIQDAYEKALDKLEDTVDKKRDAFGSAWSRLGDKALRVFDAKTQELLAAAGAKYEALTPAEQRLATLDTYTTTLTNEDRVADARRALEEAHKLRVGWDGTQAEIEQKIQDAERELRIALLEQEKQGVQAEAEAERAAADKAREEEQKAIEDQRDALREVLADRLDMISEEFNSDEPETIAKAQKDLAALLADPEFQDLFADAGSLIGQNFAGGFTTALAAVTVAVKELTAALTNMATATGLAPAQLYSPTGTAIYGEGAQGAVIQDPTHGYAMAGGGKVPGVYVGRKDTVAARLTPGETVIDRQLTAMMEDFFAGGGEGVIVNVNLPSALRGDEKRIAKKLGAEIQSDLNRRIGYGNRRG